MESLEQIVDKLCSLDKYISDKNKKRLGTKHANMLIFADARESLGSEPSESFRYMEYKCVNGIPFGSSELESVTNGLTDEERKLLKL